MEEITPDLVARLASRIYNEVPMAGQVPKSEVGAQELPNQAIAMPAGYAGSAPPETTAPSPSLANMVAPNRTTPGFAFPTEGVPQSAAPSPSFANWFASNGTTPGFAFAPPASVPEGAPSSPSAPKMVAPNRTTPGFAFPIEAIPEGAAPNHIPVAFATPSNESNGDGLRAFVQNLRRPTQGSGRDRCLDPSSTSDLRHRLSVGRNIPTSGSRPLDVPAIREDFPILKQRVHGKPLAWLDNAATTQKPQSVIDALSRFYSNDNSNIHRGAHTLAARATDAYEQARQKVQMFLGASSAKEIIFVRGTTEGINLVTQTYGRKFLQPGDEIILSTLEHHANIVPWQMVAKEKGAVIRVIPVNDRGEIMMEEYQRLLSGRTKVVALTQASNSLGTILPVAEMTQMAKRYGARVLIDGAQSVAHIPVNMQQLGADFFVFSGHKIFGPTGIGVVYMKEELHEIVPPWQGGGNMIRNVTFEETTYNDAPAKFEAGTPNIADAVGLGAALDYVNSLGLPNIAAYEHELLQYATELLSQINGLRLIGTAREKVGVLSFVLPHRKSEEIGKILDQEGIAVRSGHHCSQPSLRRFGVETTVRPSLSLYNTKDEIDRLADTVKRIQHGR